MSLHPQLRPPPLPVTLGYEPVRFVDASEAAPVVVSLAFSALVSWRVRLFDGVLEELAFAPRDGPSSSPLLRSAAPVLEGLVEVLAEHGSLSLTLSVTSGEGRDLPERRAHASACAATLIDFLAERGLDRSRFVAAALAQPLDGGGAQRPGGGC